MKKEVIIPMITPFKNDKMDDHAIQGLFEYARENDFSGLFPAGSSGGFMALSNEEQSELLSKVIDKVNGSLELFAGISRNNIDETLRMGKLALDYGYENLVIINPSYHKYSDQSIYNYFSYLTENLDGNIILYNNPPLSGKSLSSEMVRKLKETYPSIKGMKDSSGDLNLFAEFLSIKNFKVYQGKDALLKESIEMGAIGGVCSTSNFSVTTAKIARGDPSNADVYAQKTRRIVELVSKYETPTLHNYLFRKIVMEEVEPSNYMKRPFAEIRNIPDLNEFEELSK